MTTRVDRFLLPFCLLVLGILSSPPVNAQSATSAQPPSNTESAADTSALKEVTTKAIDDAFNQLCAVKENEAFYLCKAAKAGDSVPGRLKAFVLMEECKKNNTPGYCRWAMVLSKQLDTLDSASREQRTATKEALQQVSGTLLEYSHRNDDWRERSMAENTEEDANGIPTVFRTSKLDLAVVITDTNPLLYEARAGEVKETDVPLVADLKAFVSLLGTGLAGTVAAITSRLEIPIPETDARPLARILERERLEGGEPRTPGTTQQQPVCEKCKDDLEPAVSAILKAVDEKRARWMALRDTADAIAKGVVMLDDRRGRAIRAIQAIESGRPRATGEQPPAEPKPEPDPCVKPADGKIVPWTAENILLNLCWDRAIQALEHVTDRVASYSTPHDRMIENYLTLIARLPEKVPTENAAIKTFHATVRATALHFLDVSKDACPVGVPCAAELESVRSFLRSSAECIECLAGKNDVKLLYERLASDKEVWKSGLDAIKVTADERKAVETMRDILQKKKDHLKVVEAIRNAEEREKSFTLNGQVVTWAYLRPRSDKFSWDKEGTHEVKVLAAAPLDAEIIKRHRDVTTSYKVRSRLSSVFGVSTGIVIVSGRGMRQDKWSRACTATKADGTCQTYVAHKTGEESHSGQLGVLFDVRPLEFVSDKARKTGLKPLAILGAGVTGELPAFYVGGGLEIAKSLRYIRIGFGRTIQKYQELNGVAVDVTPLATETIPTRDDFRWGWFGSISIGLDALSLFTKPAS